MSGVLRRARAPSTPTVGRAARIIVVIGGMAFALGAEAVRLQAGWDVAWVLGDALPGLAFLAAGLVAWERRPETRIGQLLVATGLTWFVGTWGATSEFTVGWLANGFQGWYDPLLAWLVLAYPTGRLGGAARVVVGAFLALLAARTAFRLFIVRPSTAYDLADPASVEQYIRDIGQRDSGESLFAVGIALLSVLVLVLISQRLLSGSAVGRRVVGPVLIGGLAFAVAVILELGLILSAGSFAERAAAWDLGQILTVVTGGLVPLAFALGLARSHLSRAAVADLVVELGDDSGAPLDLRGTLARATGDPSLEIAYPVPGTDGFVDADARPLELPPATSRSRGTTRLESGGRLIAVLVHDAALAEQRELVRSVAAAARLALDNERLAAEVRSQLREVQASRARIVAAGDAERRRVERDLHDGAQQRLVTLALLLHVARQSSAGADPALAAQLDQATSELELALGELRSLARGLHPTVLTEEGLTAAVEALADRSPVAVTVDASTRRYASQVEAAAYFVVSEALTNVAKYARARAVRVRLAEDDPGTLTVEVRDDGVGGADPAVGSGLRGLDDRVAAIGGRLAISSAPGRGTTIRADLPCG